MKLKLTDIRLDGGTQPRAVISDAMVAEYAEDMRESAVFPPVSIVFDGISYWLWDGFHRYHGARVAGLSEIEVDVRQGALRDAVLLSLGANSIHGFRRTNEDKRQAVVTALQDSEWGKWSDREIARQCAVGHAFVDKVRSELSAHRGQIELEPRLVRRGDSIYSMNTSNIGRTSEVISPLFGPPEIGDGEDDDLEDDLPENEIVNINHRYQVGETAYCKYCYTRHNNWQYSGDSVDAAWLCTLCEHTTLDALMDAGEEASPAPGIEDVSAKPQSLSTFNRTNDNIEWASWSWNPVTGCLTDCAYCYARDIANRFYPEKFKPTFRPERLDAPQNTKLPDSAKEYIGDKNVFVCSMADLFGNWVPQEWIDAVMASVRQAHQWNFLFLTKYPKRLADIEWYPNCWVGTTVDMQNRVKLAQESFRLVKAPVRFLSCEPMQERLTFDSLEMFDWVIMGGRSANTQLPSFQPEWEWVEHLVKQARASNCKIYFKPNLTTRPREYPTD